jgi:hypothetical protein
MLVAIWPVLVWSKMGEREARYQAEQLIYQAAYPLLRLLLSSWLAGVMLTALAASGVLLGRLIFAELFALLPWVLSVLFIPTLALTLGIWSRSSKPFEVIYPILWYLGPFNSQNQLLVLDYLGVHPEASVITSPLPVAGFIALLMLLALIGRQRQMSAYGTLETPRRGFCCRPAYAEASAGYRMSCVQRKSAITRPLASSITSASQTWVVRPPWASRASHASLPARAVPRKLVLSSIVVKPRPPSGRLARVA